MTGVGRTAIMALTYEISPSGDQVRVVGTGEITTADCIGLVRRVIADPRNHPDSSALVDLRNATYQAADLAEVIDIAKALETFHFGARNHVAIVAKESLLLPTEIFVTHVKIATDAGIKVFVDLAAAEAFVRENAAFDRRPE